MSQDFDPSVPDADNAVLDDVAQMAQNFDAIKSLFSGSATPSNPVAFQMCGITGDLGVYQWDGTQWLLMWYVSATGRPARQSELTDHAGKLSHVETVHGLSNKGATGNIDAQKLQGQPLSYFATAGHKHPGATDLTSPAYDSAKLAGYLPDIENSAFTVPVRDLNGVLHSARFAGLADTATLAGSVVDSGVTEAALGAGVVSQAKLKTSYGETEVVGTDMSFEQDHFETIVMPGGEYAFTPGVKVSQGSAYGVGKINHTAEFSNTSYARLFVLGVENQDASPRTIAAMLKTRYVTSSGEIFWYFILRDKASGAVRARWLGPDHPCFGNGADPEALPHPFASYDPESHEIVVITAARSASGNYEGAIGEAIELAESTGQGLGEVLSGLYEVDCEVEPRWPDKEITVGHKAPLHKPWAATERIKALIPQPPGVLHRSLRRKKS